MYQALCWVLSMYDLISPCHPVRSVWPFGLSFEEAEVWRDIPNHPAGIQLVQGSKPRWWDFATSCPSPLCISICIICVIVLLLSVPTVHNEVFNERFQHCFQHPAPLLKPPLVHFSLKKGPSPRCRSSPLPFYMYLVWTFFFSVVVVVSFLFMKAEETEFQQASDGNPEWIFLFPSQQPLPQWGSQRGVSQEVWHHSVPGKKPSKGSAHSLAVVESQGRVLEVLLSWTFMPYKFHQLKP